MNPHLQEMKTVTSEWKTSPMQGRKQKRRNTI